MLCEYVWIILNFYKFITFCHYYVVLFELKCTKIPFSIEYLCSLFINVWITFINVHNLLYSVNLFDFFLFCKYFVILMPLFIFMCYISFHFFFLVSLSFLRLVKNFVNTYTKITFFFKIKGYKNKSMLLVFYIYLLSSLSVYLVRYIKWKKNHFKSTELIIQKI